MSLTIAAGEKIVVCEAQGTNTTNNTTPTDSGGTNTYNQIDNVTGTSRQGTCYESHSGGAVTTVSCNWTNTSVDRSCVVYDINGSDLTSTKDASIPLASGSSSTSCTSGSLTTTNANDMLIYWCRVSGDQTSFTATTNYAIPTNGQNARAAAEHREVTATQSGLSVVMTHNASNSYVSIFFGIKQAAAAGACVPSLTLLGVGAC